MKKIICCGLVSVLLLLSLTACSKCDYPVSVGKVSFDTPAEGIVSMSPVVTAALVELGLTEKLVAVGTGCQYPPYTDGLPTVGTVDFPNIDKMKEVSAKVVFLAGESVPAGMSAVEKSNMKVACVSTFPDLKTIEEIYGGVAAAVKGANLGGYLASNYIKNVTDQLEPIKLKTEKTFLYILSDKGYVASEQSIESDLLDLVGLKNVVSEKDGFTPSADIIKAYHPDYIFVSPEVNIDALKANEIFAGMQIIADSKQIPLSNKNMVTGHLSAAAGEILSVFAAGGIK